VSDAKDAMIWNYLVGIFFLVLSLPILYAAINLTVGHSERVREAADRIFEGGLLGFFGLFSAFVGVAALRRAHRARVKLADPRAVDEEVESAKREADGKKARLFVRIAKIIAVLSVGITVLLTLTRTHGSDMSGVPMAFGLMIAAVFYGVGKIIAKRHT
jgi:hypothetical protein